MSRQSCSCVPVFATRTQVRTALSPPHFSVSVARGTEVSKVQSITELCGLRVSVESYVATKGPLQCKRCQRFGHTQRNCGYAPRCVASATLESLHPEDQSLWRMTKRVMRVPTPSPPLVTTGGIALSDSEKAEALADSLESQFQPVTDHRSRQLLRWLTWSWGPTLWRLSANPS